jgi:hypothetical protein
VRANESNVQDLEIVVDLYDQPVFVSANVKYNAIPTNDAGVWVSALHVARTVPISS